MHSDPVLMPVNVAKEAWKIGNKERRNKIRGKRERDGTTRANRAVVERKTTLESQ